MLVQRLLTGLGQQIVARLRPIATNEVLRKSSLTSSAKAGWTWGCVATVDFHGRTIFVADAHRDDRKRFDVRADEKVDGVCGT